jgi:GTP-binding protein
MLHTLNEQCQAFSGTRFTLQAVITKADTVPVDQVATMIPKMRQQIFEAAPFCLPPIITSATMQPRFGIEEMRRSIVEACGIGRINSG